jgi:RNA polymerase sigma-70 factor (ECF subfamily)
MDDTNAQDIKKAENAELIQKYINLVYKICITRLGDCIPSSVDDACQQVFLNFISNNPVFNDTAQEKAWFAKVSINVCNNIYKQHKRKSDTNIDLAEIADMPEYAASSSLNSLNSFESFETAEMISVLPDKLRDAFYLTCIEDYTSREAAQILQISAMAVRTRVKRAREILRKTYEKEDFIYER